MSIRPEQSILCADDDGRLTTVVEFSLSPYPEGSRRDLRDPRLKRIYGLDGMPYFGLESLEDGQAFRIPGTERLLRRVGPWRPVTD